MASRQKDLERALNKEYDRVLRKLWPKDNATKLDLVGKATVDVMKDRIKKGISPISGRRFPAYKRGRDPRGYPNTVRDKFPAKRRRPVNLFLSGDFLSNLTYKLARSSFRLRSAVKIGFWDSVSVKKESGHRTGANGQPKRPIIPTRNESFSRSIAKDLRLKLVQILKNNSRRK